MLPLLILTMALVVNHDGSEEESRLEKKKLKSKLLSVPLCSILAESMALTEIAPRTLEDSHVPIRKYNYYCYQNAALAADNTIYCQNIEYRGDLLVLTSRMKCGPSG